MLSRLAPCVLALALLGAAPPPEVVPLVPGVPVERELAAGESHRYSVDVPAGHFLQVTVEQRGVDVELRLLDGGGREVARRDGPYGAEGAERLSWVIEEAGASIVAVMAAKTTGAYRLTLTEPRPATSRERALVRAEDLSFRALLKLDGRPTTDDLSAAIALWDEALPLWSEAEDGWGEAEALYWSAKALEWSKQPAAAVARYERAASRYEATTPIFTLARRQVAHSLTNQGALLRGLGDLAAAEAALRKAATVWADLQATDGENTALSHLALALRDRGHLIEARELLSRCLALSRQMESPVAEAHALTNLGHTEKDLGRFPEALDHLRSALEIWEQRPEAGRGKIATLNSLGSTYTAIGDYTFAIRYYEDAREASRTLHDRYAETAALNNLGRVHRMSEDYASASTFLRDALHLAQELGFRDIEADALDNLARFHLKQGEADTATDLFRQALTLTRDLQNRREEAATLLQLGEALRDTGGLEEAKHALEAALAMSIEHLDPAIEARSLGLLATVESLRGNHHEAVAQGEAALEVVESLRSTMLNRSYRLSFAAAEYDLYEWHIAALMAAHRAKPKAGWAVRALETVDRARARNLLDLFHEAEVDIREGAPPELLEKERHLLEQLADAQSQRFKALDAPGEEGELERLGRVLDDLLLALGEVDAEIRAASPLYSNLTQPEVVSIQTVQESLVGSQKLLLAYSLGEEKSFLWAITRKRVESFELPGRAQIEPPIRELRRLLENGSDPAELADTVSRLLLRPVARLLKDHRLVILPDGILHSVPFAILADPRSKKPTVPLLARHTISYAPSLSVLAELGAKSPPRDVVGNCLAVVSDPVFGPTDPRWLGVGREELPPSTEAIADQRSGFRSLGRLPATAVEAETILSMVPEGRRLDLNGLEASSEAVQAGRVSECGILHFATHGLVDADRPDLSGLALSRINAAGKPLTGFLALRDLYRLDLSSPLVVLSACETAVGKQTRGEGVISLTHGFFAAGARTVVASLWNVDDRATAWLMEHFYRNLLATRLEASEALRRAQLEMQREQRFDSTSHWGAFILHGHPK